MEPKGLVHELAAETWIRLVEQREGVERGATQSRLIASEEFG